MSWSWVFWVISALGSYAHDSHASSYAKHNHTHGPVVESQATVDINHADYSTLAKLTGLGPKQAESIVEYRKQHGAFKTVNDLTQVKGISKRRVTRLVEANPNLSAKP